MKHNYHTHTTRCSHASGTDEEYVKAAIEAGFSSLGFSDHSPMIFPESFGDYYSGYRIKLSDAEGYFESVRELKEKYKKQIDIHLGVEIEYYPLCFEKTYEYLKNNGVEYLILGQHFVGNEHDDGSFYAGNPPVGNEDAIIKYADILVKCIESGNFLYVAHPDVFRGEVRTGLFEEQSRRICEASNKYDVPLECNILGMRGPRYYPTEEFWKIAGEMGVKAVFGVDAHDPTQLLDANEVLKPWEEKLLSYGVNLIDEKLI